MGMLMRRHLSDNEPTSATETVVEVTGNTRRQDRF